MKALTLKYWTVEQDSQVVVWCGIATPDSTVNTLNNEALDELHQIIASVKEDFAVRGLVIHSQKPGHFLAGADVHYFSQFTTTEQIRTFIHQGQTVFNELAALPIPTVALIHGLCLGGGLELALACRYRIAIDDKATKLGLPEVKLGILPAWGGLRRLPALIGAIPALSWMLEGKVVDGKTARRAGLVDALVPQRQWRNAVHAFINTPPKPHVANRWQRLSNHFLVRPPLSKWIERQLKKRVSRQHYPAPYAMLILWQKHGIQPLGGGRDEVESVCDLLEGHDTARNLLRVFHLQELLKSQANTVEGASSSITHVHVIGAGGIMGGDIAIWCALQGFKVTLQDRAAEYLGSTFQRAHSLFRAKLKERRHIRAALDRLMVDLKGDGLAKADVVIEAVPENLELKQKVLAEIEKRAKPEALIATNTSSLPLETIASLMQQPQRLVGVHFFNPVAKMPLVEVVKGETTPPDVVNAALGFVRAIDKLPLPVKSSPGFLVNRLLMPYLLESMKLWEEGVPASLIDKTVVAFGMPMGPIELADTVGLDVCLSVARYLAGHYGGTIPAKLESLVTEGHLGRKTSKGFYEYQCGKPVKDILESPSSGETNIVHRLLLRMLNEAFACLEQGVVQSADLLDAGMIFGAGFAPFRGGLLHYARAMGMAELTQLYQQLEHQYGERFRPTSAWLDLLRGLLASQSVAT